MKRKIYSVCGMCTVRCPIEVDVDEGECAFIQGNQRSPLKGALCARGGAGAALSADDERPQYPMIRDGERGSGKWRRASWDEAFDYVAGKLKAVMAEHGARSILWSDRGGPFVDLHHAFLRGLGTPNYCSHDASCARNVQHACQSVTGIGRTALAYDYKNAKHVVFQTRNVFESINVKEINDVLDGLDAGAKLTCIDVRANVTASKADRFMLIRPGTDHALNLAVIREILDKNLHDAEFAARWIEDLDGLRSFVEPYSLEWAERETGVPAGDIAALVGDLAEAKPAVVWHPGWMVARYSDSFHVCRTAYVINALLGSIGAKGGLPLVSTPADAGRKGLRKLAELYPKPEEKRADGCGWKYPQFDPAEGLLQLAYEAIETGAPYPIKAYVAYRHDPLMAFPDPEAQKRILDKLDLLVSVTFSWSDTAWHSDVILPLSPYLERDSIIAGKSGLKPQFFVRRQALAPRFDTKADWEIICGLAERMGLDKLAFKSVEDIWNFQLEGTGVTAGMFDDKGFVELADKPRYRAVDELKFKTPSGKLEMVSEKWEKAGVPSLKPYEPPTPPPDGAFRIAFGRCGLHTQGHTVNNPLLGELMPANVLWLNKDAAERLGVASGDLVEVLTADGGESGGRLPAFVTEFIHPEAVFMVHGFGHRLPVETRAQGKGVADQELMPGGLGRFDPAGGGLSLQEHFVRVRKV